MSWLSEQFYLIDSFIDSGGPVLLGIAFLLLLLWILMIERSYYFWIHFPVYQKQVINRWGARSDKASWHALQIRDASLAQASMLLKQNMDFLL